MSLNSSMAATANASSLDHSAAPKEPSKWFGFGLAVAVALVATLLGGWMPVIGGPVFGILIGIAIRNTLGVGPMFRPGLKFSSKQILQWSIIGLGFGLSIQQVATIGLESLGVTLVVFVAAFVSACVLGKLLGIPAKLKTLIGVGTAICGGTAIAATAPVLKPEEHETAYAISTIFLFNVIGVVAFPVLGHWMGMSDVGFGLWSGTAINDTSSVVAAAYSFSQEAGDYATVVKLTRATFIIPLCLVLAFYVAWREKREGTANFSLARIFPWFILWFLAASLVRSTGILPPDFLVAVGVFSKFLIVVALTAIGLSTDLRSMAIAGMRPILMGLGVWVAVAGSSLAMIHLLGVW
ncbi:MAG: YeiH family protein [Burkholderiaceae bacterium]|jgi:uncharacterized integral membrane protein (TIGR00698 family)